MSVLTSTLQKSEGFRVKATTEGESRSFLLRVLKSNAEFEVLRLSHRVNNKAKSTASFEYTDGEVDKLKSFIYN